MLVDIEWDDAVFLVALLKAHPGRRAKRVIRSLVVAGREYAGDSCDTSRVTVSADMQARIAFWTKKLL